MADGPVARLAASWGLFRRRVRRYVPRPFLPVITRVLWDGVTFPATALALFVNPRIHPGYGLGLRGRLRLACRIYLNSFRIFTFTSFKAHLAMAVKLLEIPPSVEGAVVECGALLGGSSANLSIACDAVGRDLIIYDSFEGLPAPETGESFGTAESEGGLRGDLKQVRRNIERCGEIDRCTFRKGWFKDTLPEHREPVVLAFVDVDYEVSLYDCVVNLWPHLVDRGYLFIDEYVFLNHCALFFSEQFWQQHFSRPPPGLLGAGTGIPLGNFYTGPFMETPIFQTATSVAYTRKDFNARWTFSRLDAAADVRPSDA